jgi:Zn-dependent oligopeptidase
LRRKTLIDAYSADVRFFRVFDSASASERGRLSADLPARPGKCPGAWEMPLEFGRPSRTSASLLRRSRGRPALIDVP